MSEVLALQRVNERFCSRCGSGILRDPTSTSRGVRHVCVGCGEVQQDAPRVVVSCVVSSGNKVLMCRRAQKPARGKWVLPSGFLECGETLQQAAARETLEETGIEIEVPTLHLFCVLSLPFINQVVFSFRTALDTEPPVRISAECLEAEFVSELQIESRQLAWGEVTSRGLRAFFEERRCARFCVHMATILANPSSGSESDRYQIEPAGPVSTVLRRAGPDE